jgi:hypothetical protein
MSVTALLSSIVGLAGLLSSVFIAGCDMSFPAAYRDREGDEDAGPGPRGD